MAFCSPFAEDSEPCLRLRHYLLATPTQWQLLTFCFVFLSPLILLEKTPKPSGQSSPSLAAPASKGPEVKLERRRNQPMLTAGPRGTRLDSPSGQWGLCPPRRLRAVFCGRGGLGEPARVGPLEGWPHGANSSPARFHVPMCWNLRTMGNVCRWPMLPQDSLLPGSPPS